MIWWKLYNIFCRKLRELGEEDFESDDEAEEEIDDNENFTFQDLDEDRVLEEYSFQELTIG